MRVLIEEYRGWEIYFDTTDEDFYTVSNEYDNKATKRSYASTKKYIDEYIKDNKEFKPIKVHSMRSSFTGSEERTLIGVRKDGVFVYQDKDGKKAQLSKYNEGDYFVVDDRNTPFFEKMEELESQRDKLFKEIKELEKNIIKVTVKDIRKNLLGE